LEGALAAYRALGDPVGVAWSLNSLGCLFATLSATAQAEACMTEALTIFRTLDDAVGTANLTCNLGELAEAEGRHELAIARLEAGLAMWQALGDRAGAVRAMVYLGQALLSEGETARAATVLREALAAIRDIDYKQILPAALRALARLEMRRGDDTAAARWYGAADGVMDALGMELPVARRDTLERALAAVRGRLGETAFVAAWTEGRSDPERVIAGALAYELSDDIGAARTTAAPEELTRLTARERDVLGLMAEGQTDKEIAAALFVTRRTASKHVSAILAKLGVPSRAAAVAVAARSGLA
jgi:DNA-binding CsgD family transcriptional regulator